MPAPSPISDRLAARVERRGSCLIWTGAVSTSGYGVIGGSTDGKNYVRYTHRLAYELANGEVPAGLHIDHLCRQRLCVEPGHLEAVTQQENNRRAAAVRYGRAS